MDKNKRLSELKENIETIKYQMTLTDPDFDELEYEWELINDEIRELKNGR